MKSASQHLFASLPSVKLGRSAFRRPMTYKTTLNAGLLYPVYYEDVLPGDTLNMRSLTCFVRMMTLITPVMDNLYIDLHAWYVPNRLVWDNWTKLCGERDAPVTDYSQDVVYTVPQMNLTNGATFASGSLGDYFGLPVGVTGLSVDAMPFRAYNLIWNEFYRDENLQQPPFLTRSDNDDSISNYVLLPRGKRKDAFTSALPWPQKGPGVEIPLGGTAPVIGNGMALGLTDGTNNGGLAASNAYQVGSYSGLYGAPVGDSVSGSSLTINKGLGLTSDSAKSGLVADLSNATAATINTLREAFQIQKIYERDARGGTRYQEMLVSHFGVSAPDSRLQRPEYLGGTTLPVNLHTVVQQSSTDNTSPQGNLSGYGTAGGQLHFTKSFVEHGMVIVLASIRADLTYQQGIDKKWSRKTRFDYYWPALAHLGEDAIRNKEIYADGSSADDGVFGYQERWYEYRYSNSKITGLLRSGVTGSLDVWHLSQHFANLPTLSDTFIREDPPIARVVAVQNQPHFLYDSLIDAVWVRPMPLYSVPGLMDHF